MTVEQVLNENKSLQHQVDDLKDRLKEVEEELTLTKGELKAAKTKLLELMPVIED